MKTPTPEIRITEKISTAGNRVIDCEIHWIGEGIDRPFTSTISLLDNPKNRKTAERFKQAVADGVVYKNVCIVKDCNGKTYVSADTPNYMCVMGKYLNSDLKKLGY